MKLGIMGAMPEEISGILDMLDDRVRRQIGGREFWEGTWSGLEVVAVFSRLGKVAAAATATVLITHFHVDHILFIGVAGGADPELSLGDVVVARDLIQHDMDASALPMFDRFEIPLLGRSRFAAHASFRDKAIKAAQLFFDHDFDGVVSKQTQASFAIGTPKVATGLIASGDRFVSDAAYLESLRAVLPDLRCVEMEGAAVAQVCFEFSTGVTVVRVISDRADHDAPVDFPRFTAEVASVMTKGIAKQFLYLLMLDLSTH
jgi:adenosylhomocysteine nucleosidase